MNIKHFLIITILTFGICTGVYATTQQSSEYRAIEKVSGKTQILIQKYPSIKEKVDVVLGKFFGKIEKRDLYTQKTIYIKLQQKISDYVERFSENPKAIIILTYMDEIIQVQLYNVDSAINIQTDQEKVEEQEKKVQIETLIQKNKQVRTRTPTSPSNSTSKPSTSISNTDQATSSTTISQQEESSSTEEEEASEEGVSNNDSGEEETEENNQQETSEEENSSDLSSSGSSNTPIQQELPGETGSGDLDAEVIVEGVDITIEQEQVAQINEIGRFTNTLGVGIDAIELEVIGDRDFTFSDNLLHIRAESGGDIATSIAFTQNGNNIYTFSFENIFLPEGVIIIEVSQFSIDPNATTEIYVRSISIPDRPDLEGLLIGQKLATKNRIELQGGLDAIQ